VQHRSDPRQSPLPAPSHALFCLQVLSAQLAPPVLPGVQGGALLWHRGCQDGCAPRQEPARLHRHADRAGRVPIPGSGCVQLEMWVWVRAWLWVWVAPPFCMCHAVGCWGNALPACLSKSPEGRASQPACLHPPVTPTPLALSACRQRAGAAHDWGHGGGGLRGGCP
jgi:hypothetical protein